MKKIGIFSAYFLPHLGGVERYVDKLSLALRKLGYEVVIVASNHDGLKNHEVIEGRSIYRLPIHNLAKSRYPLPKVNAEYRDLIRRIEAENIDYFLVNTRFSLTSFVGARMGKRQGRPVMLLEHGTDHFTVNNRWLDYLGLVYEHGLTALLKRYVDKYYGVSKKCNIWLKHYSIKADGVLYNAVDLDDAKKVEDLYKAVYKPDEVVITYAGRLIKEKGILNLLEAFMKVKQARQELKLKLVVAGDGVLLKSIREKYDDPAIDILGKLDFRHVMALYKRSDIFVLPSLYPEGLPTSILEAGLMECAVIATPRGGTEEVIVDEHHGIIVDGSIDSLCEALERLVMDPSERAGLGKAIKARIEDSFNWTVVAKVLDNEINTFKVK